jgi:hypothetical protein
MQGERADEDPGKINDLKPRCGILDAMQTGLLSRLLVVVGAGLLVACSSKDEDPPGPASSGGSAGAGGSAAGTGGQAGSGGEAGAAGVAGSGGAAGGGFVNAGCTETSPDCTCGPTSYCTACQTPEGVEPCCVPCGAVPGRPLRVGGGARLAALRAAAWG